MSDIELNPLENIYKAFISIIKNVTIKYVSKAEEFETYTTKTQANEYLDALNKKDTFLTHRDYKKTDYYSVGLTDPEIIREAVKGNVDVVPKEYRNGLLDLYRKRIISEYEEQNNYYRVLNGYPELEDTDYCYISETLAN